MSILQTMDNDQSPRRQRFPGLRVPPNLFAIALGIAGLAQAWHAAVPLLGTPQAVPDALNFLAVTMVVGGWLTGQWMTGGIDPDSVHPGYFLPTAAGGLIGANAAAQVHLHALAEASFGIGVICWALLASTILNRLFTRPALPSPVVPTMAIELGVAGVAGSAYFEMAGQTVSFMAYALGGYAVLMALVQVRLIPVYLRLSFTPGFWSFAFAYAAAGADALVWLSIKKPPAATGYAIAVVALLTAFVSWIVFRTLVLAVRGQLFPALPPVHRE